MTCLAILIYYTCSSSGAIETVDSIGAIEALHNRLSHQIESGRQSEQLPFLSGRGE